MAKQAIKYQTTEIDPSRSAAEIMGLVERYGASRFEMQWDNRELAGIRFAVLDEELGEVPLWLKARTETIEGILRRTSPFSRSRGTMAQWEQRTREQARRIAWRQLKDFAEQALLAVETGLFRFTEAFMTSVETTDPETGERTTWGELTHRQAMIGSGASKVLRLPAAGGR